jgi:4-amino-4-deoxy-L-arabinose transferase-like glycosyltransferase
MFQNTVHGSVGKQVEASGIILPVALLFVLSIVIGSIGLDHLPRNDELYTLLAARGWLTDGVPSIADGVYDRAQLYTILVAQFFQVFGESLVIARLPSLIAGGLLAVAVFLWTRAVAGNLAAWIAALFVCLSPLSIQMSQYARFYALFGLVFWLGAVGVYVLVERRWRWWTSLLIAAGSAACLALAIHLQALAAMGGIGLGVWLGLAVIIPWLWSQRHRPGRLWLLAGSGAVLLAVGAFVAIQSGLAAALWDQYRYAPLHAAPRSNMVWFYQLAMIERYPTLWPIFPFTALLALAIRPRPSLFCCCIFVPAFGLLSLAAMKHFNYIFFVLPFLFVIWGISLAGVLETLWRWITQVTDHALTQIAPDLPRRPIRWVLIVGSLLFLIVSNGAPARTLLKPFGISLTTDETSNDWTPVKEALAPWLEQAPVVLTPNDLYALYYLEGYDVAVNPNLLSEMPGDPEFSLDPRTGRPVIATAASLRLLIDCYPEGLYVADDKTHPLPWAGTAELNETIRSEMTPIDLPDEWRIFAFRWENPEHPEQPAECASLLSSMKPAAGQN